MERSAEWMDQAEGDLAHAHYAQGGGFCDWACFSAQQASEKAVRAVLQKLGAEAWGHSVAELLGAVPGERAAPAALVEAAKELDKADIPSRSPDALPADSPRRLSSRGEAERLVAHAEGLVRFCQSLLASL